MDLFGEKGIGSERKNDTETQTRAGGPIETTVRRNASFSDPFYLANPRPSLSL